MIIAISGPAGVGKSTVAKEISNKFDLEEVNAGRIFREMAEERDMGLNEFQKLAENNAEIDKMIDEKQRKIAKERTNLVLDAWLAGWMAEDNADLKVWLDAPKDVRMKRISERESKDIEEVRIETIKRERSNKRRFKEYYDIDLDDLSIYDMILNTEKWDILGVVKIIEVGIEGLEVECDA